MPFSFFSRIHGVSSFIICFVAFAPNSFAGGGGSSFGFISYKQGPEIAPGEVIVKRKASPLAQVSSAGGSGNFFQSSSKTFQKSIAQQLSQSFQQTVFTNDVRVETVDEVSPELSLVHFPDTLSVVEVVKTLKRDPSIEYVEPNYIMHAMQIPAEVGVPNDPDYQKLWGMKNKGQEDSDKQKGINGVDIGVEPLWRQGITGSRKIIVGIIDSGISWTHPDLVDNLYTNPGEAGELANNGIDDDGNGYIDDEHGWNFIKNKKTSNDDNSHGTHCAGTIGATGDNGVGVVGVNWQVSLMPLKFLSASGSGKVLDAVKAIEYAIKMKVHVLSNSWGGGGYSQALYDAVKKAEDAGILYIVAAGNAGQNNNYVPAYPANIRLPNVLSVAAVDNRGLPTYFSSYGNRRVHVAAPGMNIYSTVAFDQSDLTKKDTYASYSGTSMATPHVAGLAALLWSTYIDPSTGIVPRGDTFKKIRKSLIKTSSPSGVLSGKVASRGIINGSAAFDNEQPEEIDVPDEGDWKSEVKYIDSPHEMKLNEVFEMKITHEGADKMRVHFDTIDISPAEGTIRIYDKDKNLVDVMSGFHGNEYSTYVEGDQITIEVKAKTSIDPFTISNSSIWGFAIDQVQVVE